MPRQAMTEALSSAPRENPRAFRAALRNTGNPPEHYPENQPQTDNPNRDAPEPTTAPAE